MCVVQAARTQSEGIAKIQALVKLRKEISQDVSAMLLERGPQVELAYDYAMARIRKLDRQIAQGQKEFM